MIRTLPALLLAGALAACATASVTQAPDRATCERLFWRYDVTARVYGTDSFEEDGGDILPGPISRPAQALRNAGCLTSSRDLDGLDALFQRLAPYRIVEGGPAVRPVPIHLGIVTGIFDEARVTRFFRGLGYRSRGVGAEGLGRRIYIGPFTSQDAIDQALAVAREAGFVAPYVARGTRF